MSIRIGNRNVEIPALPAIPTAAQIEQDPGAMMRAQRAQDARTAMISFLTNVMKSQHEAQMAIIGNMR